MNPTSVPTFDSGSGTKELNASRPEARPPQDITGQKEGEAALRLNEERYHRRLVEESPDMIFIGCEGKIVFINQAGVKLLGGTRAEEVLGKPVLDFIHPEDREIVARRIAGGGPAPLLEERYLRLDGTAVDVEVTAIPLTYEGRPAAQVIVRDISQRKQAEAQLRKLATAVAQSPSSIVITDRAGRIEFVNPKFSEVSGYLPEEVLGRNPRLLKSGESPAETYEQMWATISAGKVWRGEFHNKRKDGELFWEAACISPVRGASGEITNFVAVKEDITEKKRLEAQFLRAQRLEGIGALASGIAHDLNNILAPVLMIAPLLRDKVSDADSRAMLDTIEGSAQRGADIIKQLLTFARGQTGVRVALPARHFLREMEKIIRETFPRDISPRMDVPRDLWLLLGDATQLQQALMNLCVNARDAMPGGGKLTLAARNAAVDEALAAATPKARPGPHVCISVADTGTGIAGGDLDRIFDPFFTTKEIGKGTGLGLATVLGIVNGHGGFVKVESRLGEGTTFELFFPAAPEAKAGGTVRVTAPVVRGQGELILVVDDEAALQTIVRRTLERHGYRVVTAGNGAQGLEVFSQNLAGIRAVVTDMMMPTMSGQAMIAAIRRRRPDLVSVGMTGLAERAALTGLDKLGLSALLTKPFRSEELLRAVHAALQPTGAGVVQVTNQGARIMVVEDRRGGPMDGKGNS